MVILRGRHSIWRVWRVRFVAPRIGNDVLYKIRLSMRVILCGRRSTWWSSSVTFRGRRSTWWRSSVTFRGRCSTWWSLSVTLRGRRSTWRNSSVTLRGRRRTWWSASVILRGRCSTWWNLEKYPELEILHFPIQNVRPECCLAGCGLTGTVSEHDRNGLGS